MWTMMSGGMVGCLMLRERQRRKDRDKCMNKTGLVVGITTCKPCAVDFLGQALYPLPSWSYTMSCAARECPLVSGSWSHLMSFWSSRGRLHPAGISRTPAVDASIHYMHVQCTCMYRGCLVYMIHPLYLQETLEVSEQIHHLDDVIDARRRHPCGRNKSGRQATLRKPPPC